MLTSLEIKNFRAFSHLVIERLGRVNLIVGKNNVGKTTLLEALQVCGSTRVPSTVRSILTARGELKSSADLTPTGENRPDFVIASLFHGRDARQHNEASIVARLSDSNVHRCVFKLVDESGGDRSLLIKPSAGRGAILRADGSAKTIDSLPEEWGVPAS